MKMVLGVEVGLSPGNFVLDGDPSPIFGPFLLWPVVVGASRCHLVWM